MNSKRIAKVIKIGFSLLLAVLLGLSPTVVFGAGNFPAETEQAAASNGKIKLTVQILNREKVANAPDPVFAGIVFKVTGEGLDGKDNVNRIGISYSRVPGTAAGKYQINGTINSDKYEVRFIPGTLTIKPSAVTRPPVKT